MNKVAFSRADHLRMRAFSYAWSLPVTWQRWRSHHSIGVSKTPCYTQTSWTYVLWNRRYCRSKFYIVRIGIVYLFAPVTLTFIDDLHIRTGPVFPRSAKVQMCENELPTSSLSKVIVVQTDTTEIVYHAASRVVRNEKCIQLLWHVVISKWCFAIKSI